MVPSVMMNGVARLVAASRPLARPMNAPVASPARMPSQTEPVARIVSAVASPATDREAPTERSRPPEMRSVVWPAATMPSVEIWNRMFDRLPIDRKRGLPTAVTATIAINVISRA
jgi:hypothetical protein